MHFSGNENEAHFVNRLVRFEPWFFTLWPLKPLHTIGKMYLNDSILYKNQEICNKTNLWKFQLISLFLLRENSKNAFSIHSNGRSFRLARRKLIIGSYFTNYSKTITHQGEILKGKLSTIVIFIPRKLCVNLWTFLFLVLPMLCRGFNWQSRILTKSVRTGGDFISSELRHYTNP